MMGGTVIDNWGRTTIPCLARTRDTLRKLAGCLNACAVDDYAGLLAYHHVRLMLTTAGLVAQAARERPASREPITERTEPSTGRKKAKKMSACG